MKRSWSRIFALTIGIPLLLGLLAACGSGTTGTGGAAPTAAGSTLIKIASELPVTGADESSGKPAQDGAQLAVNQANAHHTISGITLQSVPRDALAPRATHD